MVAFGKCTRLVFGISKPAPLQLFLTLLSWISDFDSLLQDHLGSLKNQGPTFRNSDLAALECGLAIGNKQTIVSKHNREIEQNKSVFQNGSYQSFGNAPLSYSVPIYPGNVGGIDEKHQSQINVCKQQRMWEDEVSNCAGWTKGTQSREQDNKARQFHVSKEGLSSERDNLWCFLFRVFTLYMDTNIQSIRSLIYASTQNPS